ncbi:MAG: T9SS type A sorting domain-containing protein [Cytophagaceae bacterium]|nr:T9SS type A sorting domain-containing protein [Cytophagaceae bacterium]
MKTFLQLINALLLSALCLSVSAQTTQTVTVSNLQFTPSSFTINSNDTILFVLSSGTHSVQYLTGPTSWATFGSFPHKLHTLAPGNYTFQCGVHGSLMPGSFTVNAIAGTTSGNSTKYELIAAPNPFNEEVTLTVNGGNKSLSTIRIFDLIGKEVATIDLRNKSGLTTYSLDFSQLKPGVYFCNVYSDDGIVETKKLFHTR